MLARQLIPYLEFLDEQWMTDCFMGRAKRLSIAKMDYYDEYMTSQTVLVLMMGKMVRTGETSWLNDGGLMDSIRGLHDYDEGGDDDEEWDLKWGESCEGMRKKAVEAWMNTVGISGEYDVKELMPEQELLGIGRMVDGTSLQVLKEIFYVVTGRRTGGEGEDGRLGSMGQALLFGGDEGLSWRCTGPLEEGKECLSGACSHLTGLVPVAKREGT